MVASLATRSRQDWPNGFGRSDEFARERAHGFAIAIPPVERGEVVGIIPEHLVRLEVGHQGTSELLVVGSMHERKQKMADLSDGFAVLPGGLGTMDETFEIVTWKQLRLHDKPIVLVDVAGYWKPLIGMVEHMIKEGFVQPAHRRLFGVVDKVEDVIPTLEAMPAPAFSPDVKWA